MTERPWIGATPVEFHGDPEITNACHELAAAGYSIVTTDELLALRRLRDAAVANALDALGEHREAQR